MFSIYLQNTSFNYSCRLSFMPLIVPKFTFSDVPKLDEKQVASLKGKVMLYDDVDKVGNLEAQVVKLSERASKSGLYNVEPVEYFFQSQLPDGIVPVRTSVDKSARLGIARAGLRGILLDEYNMVVGFL